MSASKLIIQVMVFNTRILLVLTATFFVFTPLRGHTEESGKIPYAANVALYRANVFLEKQEIHKAIKVLKSFQARRPKKQKPEDADPKGYGYYLVFFTLGNCYLMLEQISEAMPYYQEALKKKPDFTPAWLNLAKCYYEQQKYADAGKAFLKGYDTAKEKKPEILYYSAVSFMISGDNIQALKAFDRLLATDKGHIKLEWKESLVRVYIANKQPRKALPYIEELAEKTTQKKQKQWQEFLLSHYVSLQMKGKALRYAEWLTRKYSLESKWWKALAHLHLLENQYENALVALTVYEFISPLTEKEKKLMADLNMSLGIPVQAVRFYEELFSGKVEKITPEIIKKLVYGYLRLYKPEKALEYVEKRLEQASDNDFLMLKGQILYEMRRYPEARAAFETVTRKKKATGEAWLMLGSTEWNLGNNQKARQAFETALTYPRQRKAAQKLLRQLKKTADK